MDMAVEASRARTPADRLGAEGLDPGDGACQPALGCTPDPRRASQAGLHHFAALGCPGHAAAARATIAVVEDLPLQSRRRPRRGRLLRRADRDVPHPLRVRRAASPSAPSRPLQCDKRTTSAWTAQQILEAFPEDFAPRY